jgi:hypothetical protein
MASVTMTALGGDPLGGRSSTATTAVGEPHHPVGHRGDGRVVRDDHRRRAELAVDAGERLEHDDPGRDVERAGRLVAQQHAGRLAIARAMATRCCSPPESCAGK